MALHLKYKDDHAIINVQMTPPPSSPNNNRPKEHDKPCISQPNFDTINKRFKSSYDIFGGKYESYDQVRGKSSIIQDGVVGGGSDTEAAKPIENTSLFRSRYNSIEEELANTPYAFTTERFALSNNNFDISIENTIESPSKDLEDNTYFSSSRSQILHNEDSLFGPSVDFEFSSNSNLNSDEEPPPFSVTQLIHAQNRYFDLEKLEKSDQNHSVESVIKKTSVPKVQSRVPIATTKTRVDITKVKNDTKKSGNSFKVLPVKTDIPEEKGDIKEKEIQPTSKRKRESSFSIITRATSTTSRPISPTEKSWKASSVSNSRRTSIEKPINTAKPNRNISPETKIRKRQQSPEYYRVSPERTHTRSICPERRKVTYHYAEDTPDSSKRPSRQRSPEYRIPSREDSPEYQRIDSTYTSPRTSRHVSPDIRRSYSQSRVRELKKVLIDERMATAIQPVASYSRPITPRNFIQENIKEIHDLSEVNREKHIAEEERKRREEEEEILKEMGVISNKTSRCSSPICHFRDRSMSPIKTSLRSRSNSPSAILHFEKIPQESRDFLEIDTKAMQHKSRSKASSKSQPQSGKNSPLHSSNIPKRPGSISPTRSNKSSPKIVSNNLNKKRYMSNSTSRINETPSPKKLNDKKTILSKSTQHLNGHSSILRSKPPLPRSGPPPASKNPNAKRLSPIVGTPNKSSSEGEKSPKPTLSTLTSTIKMANRNTSKPLVKSLTRSPSKPTSPEKKPTSNLTKTDSKSNLNLQPSQDKKGSIKRTPSNSNLNKPPSGKADLKKVISKANTLKTLTRTPSSKNAADKKETLNKSDSKSSLADEGNKKDNKEKVTTKNHAVNAQNMNTGTTDTKSDEKSDVAPKKLLKRISSDEVITKDMGIQLDKISTNGHSDNLIPLTKMNIVSMTTAAITSQPLDVVTKVTNQLPGALERARERILEKTDSDDAIVVKGALNSILEKKASKNSVTNTKEVTSAVESVDPSPKNDMHKALDATKIVATEPTKPSESSSLSKKTEIDEDNNVTIINVDPKQPDYKKEAKTIVDSILTPVETPSMKQSEPKKTIDPIVTVVKDKSNIIKVNEALVKGDGDAEVQSGNLSVGNKMAVNGDGASVNSAVSNGGKWQKSSDNQNGGVDASPKPSISLSSPETPDELKFENEKRSLCDRITCGLCGKCRKKFRKSDTHADDASIVSRKPGDLDLKLLKAEDQINKNTGFLQKLNCCKRSGLMENESSSAASIRKPSLFKRIFCCHCMRRKEKRFGSSKPGLLKRLCCCYTNRISDSASDFMTPRRSGCFGCCRRDIDMRRDSILSDPRPRKWWQCVSCCKKNVQMTSRRPSNISKNKSFSPPPEDKRPKLDQTLVEHASVIRAAIPVLPLTLAYVCCVLNFIIPGLGTILSGIFCMCFGIPRFGVHDGMKQRLGALILNFFVGIGQLFTVIFCLVGWGWSIWWGVTMVKLAKKYRKIREHEKEKEAELADQPTTNNHRP